MQFNRKIAIPVIAAAALMGTGGIAYANVTPSPTYTPTVSPTPTVTPTVSPLPVRCYRATDHEVVTAPGQLPVRETVQAIVCHTRFGIPVVFVDTNAFPIGR